jgi:hypothetical protein
MKRRNEMAEPAPAPVPMDSPNQITINSDGSFTPATGVQINPGGMVQFQVSYPQGTNTCIIPFGTITFSNVAGTDAGGSNTIKVG